MLSELFKILGLSTPFVYAAAAYGFFHYLDKQVAGPTNSALSNWIRRPALTGSAATDAVVAIFDRIYGPHLFSISSFLRSAAFSIVVAAIFAFECHPAFLVSAPQLSAELLASGKGTATFTVMGISDAELYLAIGAATNILSDYISLFLIRRWLSFASGKPLLALFVGPLLGAFVVVGFFVARNFLIGALKVPEINLALDLRFHPDGTFVFTPMSITTFFVIPAIAVYLWLPILAICILFAQALSAFRWTAAKLQWFLKMGQQHPLQAVGYLAAVLMLVAAASLNWLTRDFSAHVLVYPAATYGLFRFLDSRASSQANSAIASWFNNWGRPEDALTSATVGLFDAIYDRPLISASSMLRSFLVTALITLAFYFESGASEVVHLNLPLRPPVHAGTHFTATFALFSVLSPIFLIGFWTNVICDYVSLFAVRHWLSVAGNRPIIALVVGAIIGSGVVILMYVVRDYWFSQMGLAQFQVAYHIRGAPGSTLELMATSLFFVIPAVAVHLWLILLVLGVIAIRLGRAITRSVTGMQSILKEGHSHPLRAIGFVAATIVFAAVLPFAASY